MRFNRIKRCVCLALCALLLAVTAPAVSVAREHLRVLAWPGYADADLVAQFEKRFDVAVSVTFVNSDDELWAKVSANKSANYDVFAVNTAELQRFIDEGLAAPINLSRIINHASQLPRFRALESIPGIVRDGKVYAVPYTFSEMGLIYNRKSVKKAPDSMAAMWLPEFRGKVLAYNTSNHNFSLTGLLMGVKRPFQMTDTEMKQAAKELVKLRRNVLTFYTSPEDSVRLFKEHDVALIFANYGMQQVHALKAAGMDVGYVIPREGALAWLDVWAVTRGASNQQLAEKWINYTLEKSVSQSLTKRQGLANTVTAFQGGGAESRLIWLEPLEDHRKRRALWDRIMSGDSLETF